MKVQTGYISYKELMINHENGHSRPTYFVIKNNDILWFIPPK